MEGLAVLLRAEANLSTLTSDVVKSTAIESERLDAKLVSSSIARRLGLDFSGTASMDRNVDDIVEMMFNFASGFFGMLRMLLTFQSAFPFP